MSRQTDPISSQILVLPMHSCLEPVATLVATPDSVGLTVPTPALVTVASLDPADSPCSSSARLHSLRFNPSGRNDSQLFCRD